MSFTPEELPPGFQTPERVSPQLWIDPKDVRAIIHLGRDAVLESVRERLTELESHLADADGVCFYKTYGPDSTEYRVLMTDIPDLAPPDSTTLAINVARKPRHDEPFFPEGTVLELADLTVPHSSRWMNAKWETLYRDRQDNTWPTPEFATILYPRFDSLGLVGGSIGSEDFRPLPARNTQDVENDAYALWHAWSALILCNYAVMHPNVATITRS